MSDNLIYEVQQMAKLLETHQQVVHKNPPREVQLMRVMKQFLPEERHEHVDKVIEVMLLAGTFDSFQKEAIKNRPPQIAEHGSIHSDGIYEIDMNCAARNSGFGNPMLVALAMSGLLR